MLEATEWREYKYIHRNSARYDETDMEPGWPPNYYLSEAGFFGNCWSVDIPFMKGKTVLTFGIIFQTDVFLNGIHPRLNDFGIILHYPNQLWRADFGAYEWIQHNVRNTKQYTLRFRMESILVLNRRNKRSKPCNPEWKADDQLLIESILKDVMCKPPYLKIGNHLNLPPCASKEHLEHFYGILLNAKLKNYQRPPPCQEIEKMMG